MLHDKKSQSQVTSPTKPQSFLFLIKQCVAPAWELRPEVPALGKRTGEDRSGLKSGWATQCLQSQNKNKPQNKPGTGHTPTVPTCRRWKQQGQGFQGQPGLPKTRQNRMQGTRAHEGSLLHRIQSKQTQWSLAPLCKRGKLLLSRLNKAVTR